MKTNAAFIRWLSRHLVVDTLRMAVNARRPEGPPKLLKDERIRVEFDVYLKKFLMSMDIILPHQAAHAFRVPTKRFGYILRVAKERYKDSSLSLGDAGEKVRDLINEHLISLGINPKVAPVELLAEDLIENLNKHSEGNAEAKASEAKSTLMSL